MEVEVLYGWANISKGIGSTQNRNTAIRISGGRERKRELLSPIPGTRRRGGISSRCKIDFDISLMALNRPNSTISSSGTG